MRDRRRLRPFIPLDPRYSGDRERRSRESISRRCVLALTIALSALSASPVRADGYLPNPYEHRTFLTTAGWELSVPVLDLRSNFINATSTTGLGLGMRFGLGTQLSAGADFA